MSERNEHKMLAYAVKVASDAHSNDLDRGGEAYIMHPIRLTMRLRTQDPELMQIALLHDVVEDHGDRGFTLEWLRKEGFSNRVINALTLLTHKKEDDYDTYIKNMAHNIDCVRVKMEDLRDNSDITRLKGLTEKDLERTRKYQKAYTFLKEKLIELSKPA
jgi:(p)ppGpp synthase/HD superfamily hydrolase